MNPADLRKEYFEMSNYILPKELAMGFVNAMDAYRKNKIVGSSICCIADISRKGSKLVFVIGDGGDCGSPDDEFVFYVQKYDGNLAKSRAMVEAIDTLNIGQESGHWLTDAIMIADDQGAFRDIPLEIFGNYNYGDADLDVLFTNM
jgi:hypothetical protein